MCTGSKQQQAISNTKKPHHTHRHFSSRASNQRNGQWYLIKWLTDTKPRLCFSKLSRNTLKTRMLLKNIILYHFI